MRFTTLVDVRTAAALAGRDDVAFVDCRFQLHEPTWGRAAYLASHLPGAAYADLDRDLSGPRTGRNGRHPLPDPSELRHTLGRLGIARGRQVIAYDQDSAMYASRLWWLVRWLGHRDVAVLDGGFAAWTEANGPTRSGEEPIAARSFEGAPDAHMVAPLEEVIALAGDPHGDSVRLIDARAPERFRGDVEPLDHAAGHIPGAQNHFFKNNLDAAGRFLDPETLRRGFADELGTTAPDRVVAYCGSGVTACHNLLALEHAGLRGARLYPGSWSEWSSDPRRPIATGS